MTDINKAAGELLLHMMTEAGCNPQGIEAVGFAVDNRPLSLAVVRAEYWFGLLYKPAPTEQDLLDAVALTA